MKAEISYSTESSTKLGTFVTGIKVERKVQDDILGDIISTRVYNIKTTKKIEKGTAYELDLKKFDVVSFETVNEEGIKSSSFWLQLKGE